MKSTKKAQHDSNGRLAERHAASWPVRLLEKLLWLTAGGMLLFIFLDGLFPLPQKNLTPPASTVVLDRRGQMLKAYLASDERWRIPVADSAIAPVLKKCVLGYEDRQFYRHPGINPVSILRAAWVDFRARHIVQGGSTLTMQVARLLTPRPRTVSSKIVEAFRALQLEWHFSKNEVLTYYFNLAPYGGNIVGVGAASYLYFRKNSAQLSLGEAALLTAIPRSPNTLRPDWFPKAAELAKRKVLERLRKYAVISAEEEKEALAEPIPKQRFWAPNRAPHFCNMLVQKFPMRRRLLSTLDPVIQTKVEEIVRAYVQPLRKRGIMNAAVVVLSNADRSVRALVGSYDFDDKVNQGEVNGALAPRSPGSSLKPFVYGLAFDRGLISERSLLFDGPVEYSGYRPSNYDAVYHGPVTARQALIRSLNVPAVKLYARLREHGLYQFLKKAGVTTLKYGKWHYGLSLVLGGCSVNLLELSSLYCGLANGGRFAPPRFLKKQPISEGDSLLSPGTAFVLSEILSDLKRPDLPSVWESAVNEPKIAWKTGTSYGHHDAWSVGYNPLYTVGVWVGNFDGKGVPELVGAQSAAPILLAIFQALSSSGQMPWFPKPKSVAVRKVCAVSGMVPNGNCPATVDELYLPGISPSRVCTLHRKILVDLVTGTRLCSFCKEGRTYRTEVRTIWPPEIASWLKENGYPVDRIPPHFPKCPRFLGGQKPKIESPASGAEYFLRPSAPLKYQKILLKASVAGDVQKVFWFLDGRLLFSGSPACKRFIQPVRGTHQIVCLDDQGRSAEVHFKVK
jgi:penicillin-binding protein 1C